MSRQAEAGEGRTRSLDGQMQTAVYGKDKQLSWTVKESLGLKKKTMVSKALAKSSNFKENKSQLSDLNTQALFQITKSLEVG